MSKSIQEQRAAYIARRSGATPTNATNVNASAFEAPATQSDYQPPPAVSPEPQQQEYVNPAINGSMMGSSSFVADRQTLNDQQQQPPAYQPPNDLVSNQVQQMAMSDEEFARQLQEQEMADAAAEMYQQNAMSQMNQQPNPSYQPPMNPADSAVAGEQDDDMEMQRRLLAFYENQDAQNRQSAQQVASQQNNDQMVNPDDLVNNGEIPQNLYSNVTGEELADAERRIAAERQEEENKKMKCLCCKVYKRQMIVNAISVLAVLLFVILLLTCGNQDRTRIINNN